MLKGLIYALLPKDEAAAKLRKKYEKHLINGNFTDGLDSSAAAHLINQITENYSYFIKHIEDEGDIKASSILACSINYVYLAKWLYENKYMKPLAQKYTQLLYKDDYGDFDNSDAKKEILKFTKNRQSSILLEVDSEIKDLYSPEIEILNLKSSAYCFPEGTIDNISLDFLTLEIRNIAQDSEEFSSEASPLEAGLETEDPYEYEQLIAARLQELGWEAKATIASGDQGADVIAETEGFKLIIQAKLYSKPVGNKAVQEAHAAKAFFAGDAAVVVTNNSFTKSARQLASSLNVHLLHHDNLEELSNTLLSLDNDQHISENRNIQENISHATSEVNFELENLGWSTYYDDEDCSEIFFAEKEGIAIFLYCTDFGDLPLNIDTAELAYSSYCSSLELDSITIVFGALTTKSGATQEAIDFCNQREAFVLINLEQLEELDKALTQD